MKINFNSPLMDFLNTTAQYVVLNIIFIICCLPIITIGPAVAALYQVILREIRGEHGYLLKKFFHHFKEMFIQSFFTSLIFFVIVLILVFNITFWNELDSAIATIISVLLYISLFVVACTVIYVFPLIARFNNGFVQTIRNAFFIAFTNPKSTILLLGIHVITIAIINFFSPSKVFMLLIGFSFIAYCNSYILNKVFKPYEPKDDLTTQL
ncbi:MAG: YesL family protein [Mobilitalea sp.]